MTECLRCGAKSELFLCPRCVTALHELLIGLPRWLTFLRQAALGQARLGSPQRRHRGDEQPMRINLAAAELLDEAHAVLGAILRHLCESRGVPVPDGTIGLCGWLADHVTAIAADEAADEHMGEIEDIVDRIDRVINRPIPPRFLGPCVTDPAPDEVLLERSRLGNRETRCNRALTVVDRSSREVTCPGCHRTHQVDKLVEQLVGESGHMLLTVRELTDWVLPMLEEPVPATTLNRWIRDGWVTVRGQDYTGAQMVQLAEVRDTRRRRPRHAKMARKLTQTLISGKNGS